MTGTKITNIIPPTRQDVWGWPAIAVFTLGGLGAGFYIMSAVEQLMRAGSHSLSRPVLFAPLGILISAAGFIILVIEIGRPLRSIYVIRNIKSAWISRELIFFSGFACLVLLHNTFPSSFLWMASVSMGGCFILSQGFIVFRSKGVEAWNVPVVPLLFLMSGLLSGYGGVLLLAALGYIPVSRKLVAMGVVLLFVRAAIWVIYIFWSRTVAFISSTKKFRIPARFVFFTLLTFGVPVVLLIYTSGYGKTQLANTLVAVTGSLIIFSGFVEKFELLRSGGELRGVTLET